MKKYRYLILAKDYLMQDRLDAFKLVIDADNEKGAIKQAKEMVTCAHYMVEGVSVNINKHGHQSVPSVRNDLYTLFGLMVGVAVFIITILVLAV